MPLKIQACFSATFVTSAGAPIVDQHERAASTSTCHPRDFSKNIFRRKNSVCICNLSSNAMTSYFCQQTVSVFRGSYNYVSGILPIFRCDEKAIFLNVKYVKAIQHFARPLKVFIYIMIVLLIGLVHGYKKRPQPI